MAAAKVRKLGKATRKAVLGSFGTRDSAAQPVTDADGQHPVAGGRLLERDSVFKQRGMPVQGQPRPTAPPRPGADM